MKKLVELLLYILHPLAVVLMWINALHRPTHSSPGHCARDSNFPRARMYAAQKISAATANSATPHR